MSLSMTGVPPLHATLPHTALVDLHMHTTASDGIWSPQALVDFAHSINLNLIAVTDHNTVRHILPVREAAAGSDLIVLGGCEVSTHFGEKLYHVLCLGLDPLDPAWERLSRRILAGRRRMYDEAFDYLAGHGYHIERQAVYIDPTSDEPVYIQHPLRTGLKNAGYIQDDQEVERIVAETGLTFATLNTSIGLEELDTILDGAFAMRVIAHPGRNEKNVSHLLDAATLRAILEVTRIDGLEARHPYHRSEQVGEYLQMARDFGLVVSSGSDAHHLKRPLLPHPIAYAQELLERCGIAVQQSGD